MKHSPTCSKEAVRITLCVAATNNWGCHTIDVKAAYLQGNPIERDVYLRPPREYDSGKLWKLRKTVYGLSDAARQWYMRMKSELLKLGANVSKLDPALFSWEFNGVVSGILCLYVDDILWAGEDAFKTNIIDQLCKLFQIGNSESNAFKYIGLNIESDGQEATNVDQLYYIDSVKAIPISKARVNNKNSDLSEKEKASYRSLVGQLNWIATQTRPDIAFEVCELSSMLKNATVAELLRLNKLVLKLQKSHIILSFPGMQSLDDCIIEAYADASFANLNGSFSQAGFVIFLKDSRDKRCPVFWESRKVKRVVKSTLAAETLALIDCAETAIYIKRILEELSKVFDLPIHCYTDNKSLADSLASKKQVDDRRLRIDMAYLKDMLENKDISSVNWISTDRQLANSLTKRGASAEQLCAAISGH